MVILPLGKVLELAEFLEQEQWRPRQLCRASLIVGLFKLALIGLVNRKLSHPGISNRSKSE
jgi:hypothetical protein